MRVVFEFFDPSKHSFEGFFHTFRIGDDEMTVHFQGSRWITLILLVFIGCEKVPTFQELTGQEKNASGNASAGSQPAPNTEQQKPSPAITAPPVVPTAVDPVKAIAEFQSKSSRAIMDEDLKLLASLPSGLEQIQSVDVRLSGVSDDGVKQIGKFPGLVELNLTSTSINGLGLESLKDCPNLRKLIVSSTLNMTPQGWEALGKVAQLETLIVSDNQLKDADVSKFIGITNLREINISRTAVTDQSFEHLAAMENLAILRLENNSGIDGRGLQAYTRTKPVLRELHSTGTQLGRAGLKHVKSIASLEVLDLSGTGLTDAQFSEMKGAVNIVHLRVGRNGLTALGMRTAQTLRNLQILDLEGSSNINDQALGEINKIKGLKKLVLHGTVCTPQGIAQYRKLNKNCEVIE